MNFDIGSMISGFVFSVIGFSYFKLGKKQDRVGFLFTGVGLMIYPYFIGSVWVSVLIGVALTAMPFILKFD